MVSRASLLLGSSRGMTSMRASMPPRSRLSRRSQLGPRPGANPVEARQDEVSGMEQARGLLLQSVRSDRLHPHRPLTFQCVADAMQRPWQQLGFLGAFTEAIREAAGSGLEQAEPAVEALRSVTQLLQRRRELLAAAGKRRDSVRHLRLPSAKRRRPRSSRFAPRESFLIPSLAWRPVFSWSSAR